jgi:quercetin dioxygenase-like cupin family protein
VQDSVRPSACPVKQHRVEGAAALSGLRSGSRVATAIVRRVPRRKQRVCYVACQTPPCAYAGAQGSTGHDHLTEVACVDVPPGKERPQFGCFNVGTVTGLHFSQASVYWHLRGFPNRDAAEAAKSANGIVVEEDGRVWLSEFGDRNSAPRGGESIAIVGPLQLPEAKSYAAVLSYAVMRPGDSSRVHTHPGPEGWYVLAGEQCLETPAGASKARAGGTTTVPPNIPMELNVTGATLRRAFALVIHDSAQPRGIPSDWKPTGACSP